MVGSYAKIQSVRKNYSTQLYGDYWLSNTIFKSSYALYTEALQDKYGSEFMPSQVLLDSEKLTQEYGTDEKLQINGSVNELMQDWEKQLQGSLLNLEYYCQENSSGIKKQRSASSLNLLASGEISQAELDNLSSIYAFYTVLNFDENGILTVKKLHGTSRDISYDWNHEFDSRSYVNADLEPIKNMTFTYGIKKDLAYEDSITSMISYMDYSSWDKAALPFQWVIVIITMLMALGVPYRLSKTTAGFKLFSKVPLEIAAIAATGAVTLIITGPRVIIMHTMDNSLGSAIASLFQISGSAAGVYAYAANIAFWFILLYVLLLCTVLLKYIFKVGLINYSNSRSIILWVTTTTIRLIVTIWRWIILPFEKAYRWLVNIDLKDKPTATIVKIVAINFVILDLVCTIWHYGIFKIIIYSIVLFVILIKYSRDIRKKYLILLKATGKIAEGNLNVTIDEDLGLFNPFKKEIKSIQEGFKNAVEEEIKSQSMKTELISNVSHDLKTPLTSIITYIDLMKDEELPNDKRREYLDILDRKSQRLKELIEDLFEMSKITSGNIKLDIMDVDVVSLMKQTIVETEDKLEASGLTLKTSFPENKVILPLDSMRTYRVFENLLVNISKYSMRDSRVYIDIEDREDKVQITLKNISAAEIGVDASEITERFVRGDKSRNTEGSGLGLAIAKSFTELQGGKLEVRIDGDLFKVIISFEKKQQ
jgi:signal transduction histidine kinase